ncbi:MAG: hypothetical protein IJY39_11230 [Clostridia bacterium]|nr:hypothetical protein [Clostridia bacterium]
MKKNWICLFLILAMSLSLFACDASEPVDSETEAITESSTETVAETEKETEQPSQSAANPPVEETEASEAATEEETETADPRLEEEYAPVVFYDAKAIYQLSKDGIYDDMPNYCMGYDEVTLHKENGKSYVKLLAYNDYQSSGEAYFSLMREPTEVAPVLAVKYRTTTAGVHSQVYTHSSSISVQGGSTTTFSLIADGEWHLAVITLQGRISGFDGKIAKHFRFDFINASVLPVDAYMEFEYIAFFNSEKDAQTFEYGEAEEVVYIDPSSGYKESELAYGSSLDMINGMGENGSSAFSYRGGNSTSGVDVFVFNDTTFEGAHLVFSGWSVVEGGVAKYVWSADGGKTWHDVEFFRKDGIMKGQDAHVITAAKRIGDYTFKDAEASKLNVIYQCSAGAGKNAQGLSAHLTDYIGKTVNVTFAAVPAKEENTLCLIAHVTGVKVVDTVEEETENSGEIQPTVDPSECTAHQASEKWYPINGEAKEQKLCVKCGSSVESRDAAFAFSADYIEYNGSAQVKGPWGKEMGKIDGTAVVPRAIEDKDIILGGWVACNGGGQKIVYRIDDGEWKECGNQPSSGATFGADILNAIETYKTGIADYNTLGRIRVTAPLASHAGKTVTVTFGIVPINNPTVVIPFVQVTNVTVPAN